jgi:ATP-dependent Lon protease
MEGRKRIKNEIMKIDHTFDPVEFAYVDLETGVRKSVLTAEELKYPMLRGNRSSPDPANAESRDGNAASASTVNAAPSPGSVPVSQKPQGPVHFTIAENQTGISYRDLFLEYFRGVKELTIIDPYIRKGYQIRNLVELMQVVLDVKPQGEEVSVHLVTDFGDFNRSEIEDDFRRVQDDLMKVDILFTYEFDTSRTLHARSITTDTGWKISLDRGLDIFQRFESGLLSLAGLDQRARYCKAFEVTYLREENSKKKS